MNHATIIYTSINTPNSFQLKTNSDVRNTLKKLENEQRRLTKELERDREERER